jgi:hypothetical protein
LVLKGEKMKLGIGLLCIIFSAVSIGCNSGADNNEVIVNKDYNPITDLKSGLEGIEKSGRLGSGFGSLKGSVIDLRKTDAAKADMLEKELTDLAALSDPAKVKAKAKEIIGKL